MDSAQLSRFCLIDINVELVRSIVQHWAAFSLREMPKKKRPSAAASANLDLGALEAELNSLVAEEDLYWTQNAAKFRAAEQTASYDEFQNIVKVGKIGIKCCCLLRGQFWRCQCDFI